MSTEPFDERLEWDRDGQYFHYLTKWMHALCQAAFFVGDAPRWAVELGRVAFDGICPQVRIWRGRWRLLENEHRSVEAAHSGQRPA